MNEMIKTIKEIHYDGVCIFKMGNFYHAYSRDSYILSYLFNYKIKEIGNNHIECGFPMTALPKVTAKLENLKINYLIIDRKNNYDVDYEEKYKKLNQYEKIFDKAKKNINCKKRINTITEFLNENLEKENFTKILSRMEEVMYESREV